MFAYTKIFTYLSTAKNSNKEHLACGKDKHKIRETHSLWRNLFNRTAQNYFTTHPSIVPVFDEKLQPIRWMRLICYRIGFPK